MQFVMGSVRDTFETMRTLSDELVGSVLMRGATFCYKGVLTTHIHVLSCRCVI